MNIKDIFRRKSVTVMDGKDEVRSEGFSPQFFLSNFDSLFGCPSADRNCMEMFRTCAEVFFPIDYIARRVAGAKFVLRKDSDDSVVWDNRDVNRILAHPNCLQTWREFVYMQMVYHLATGNAFVRAVGGKDSLTRYKWSNHWWVLPSDCVSIIGKTTKMPIYGSAKEADLIDYYRLRSGQDEINIRPEEIHHQRDLYFEFNTKLCDYEYLKSSSRLTRAKDAVSNLLAVYSARNIIYVRRGALGFIVSQKKDDTGSVAMTKKEKQNLQDSYSQNYGLGKGQFPYAISDQPIQFIRTAMSISDMQPFDETLADAITIAGLYDIPSVLVPRKDQSTFSNQSVAEKSVYAGVIIPLCERFCDEFTHFAGLDKDGLYLSCDFSSVDCLQLGRKNEEQVKKIIDDRCRSQFISGIITLNDWRAQIGESRLDIPIFGKLKFEMTMDEIEFVDRIVGTNYTYTYVQDGDKDPDEATEEDSTPTGNVSNNAKL